MSNTLYDQDFFARANEQARVLRAGRLSEADIEHIAEEIESMGRSEKREFVNRLSVLLMHHFEMAVSTLGARDDPASNHRGTTPSAGRPPAR